mmetsp:Transcript_11480/g.44504  ORF Transcript_11480/g.44504 Transcript_11480/m.44504 type:complete len:227 (+) Transcript_11480:873-1553(+)
MTPSTLRSRSGAAPSRPARCSRLLAWCAASGRRCWLARWTRAATCSTACGAGCWLRWPRRRFRPSSTRSTTGPWCRSSLPPCRPEQRRLELPLATWTCPRFRRKRWTRPSRWRCASAATRPRLAAASRQRSSCAGLARPCWTRTGRCCGRRWWKPTPSRPLPARGPSCGCCATSLTYAIFWRSLPALPTAWTRQRWEALCPARLALASPRTLVPRSATPSGTPRAR